MQDLVRATRQMQECGAALPFAVYSSIKEQRIVNVPIIKPLLVCVLEGRKSLGEDGEIDCPAGHFVFLSNRTGIDMRNIPGDGEYFAMLIEFEYEDFNCLPPRRGKAQPYLRGALDPILQKTLHQFAEWSAYAPPAIWPLRRQEILQMIYHLGHTQVSALAEAPSLSHKLHAIISADLASDIRADVLAARLALSESTLRRKLAAEGSSLQAIKDRARLGHGLHLVQTTLEPIGRVAERCGYQSQSRFTDKFKQAFGITPTDLRKTRLRE